MPSFTFTSPEGQSYTVNGPEGATEEQAWGILQQQLGMPAAPAAAAPTAARRPEDVGFLEGAASSLAKGITSFGDIASGYGVAGTKLAGTDAELRAKMSALKQEAQKLESTPGMTFEDLQRIYKKSGLVDALAQAPKYVTEQILQSAPQMALPLAAGEAAAALSAPVLGPAAPLAGLAAGITTYGAQQFGNFMQRQAQELNRPEDVNVGRAAGAAAATAPLGYIVDKFATGLGGLGEKGIVEVTKELAKRKAAGEIGAAGVAAGVAKQAGKGAVEGFIAEAPTEVLESVAERAQAKLPLTDDKAKREYLESFMGAGVAGGTIGAGSRGVAGVRGVQAAQAAQAEEQKAAEQEAAIQAFEQAKAQEAAPAVAPEVTPEAAPATPAAPVAEDVNAPAMDREAMLKELEDQIASAEAPVSEGKPEEHYNKLQSTEAPAEEPVAEETPVEAPKPKTVEDYRRDVRNGEMAINAVRENRITQEQYERYQSLANAAREELNKLQSAQAEALTPEKQEALQIAEKMEALGEKSFATGIRAAVRNPKMQPNLQFYRERLSELQQQKGAEGAPVPKKAHGLEYLVEPDGKAGTEKLELFRKTAPPRAQAIAAQMEKTVQSLADTINEAGFETTQTRLSQDPGVHKLSNALSGLYGTTMRLLNQQQAVAKNHKTADPAKVAATVETLRRDIIEANRQLRQFAQTPPEIRAQEQAIAEATKAAKKLGTQADSLWGALTGKLDQGEVRDIFSANPTLGQRRLQIKGGKKVTGAQVSDLVSDGTLDRFLPPDMRHDSPAFDETEATELIKQKVRDQDYFPFDTKIEIEQIFGSVQEAEKLVDEYLTIQEQNLELQTAADEQRESEISTRAIEPEGEGRPAEPAEGKAREPEPKSAPELELAAQTEAELKSKQDEVDRLEKENARLEKEAEAKAKADAEREEFVLTGSNRPADEAAARGQKGIFEPMQGEAKAATKTFTPLTDADGKPVVVYRGALGPEESAFAPTSFFGSGFFGKGINLTSSPEDASKYASTDAEVNIDLPGRASIMADALGIDYNEAKAELTKGGGKVYPLLVSMNNPLVVGKNKIQVSEPLLRLALAESNFQGTDADADRFVRQFNKAADGVEQFNVALNNKATTIYRQIASLQNNDGLIIQPELAPKGKGATHYLVFDKDQIKSVFETEPTAAENELQFASGEVKELAKQYNGEIVYGNDDLGLMRAHGSTTGEPIYVPYIKNQLFQNDIEQFPAKSFGLKEFERNELIKAKQDLEAKAAQEHATKPFLTIGKGVTGSKDIPGKVVSVAKGWAKMLKLTGNIHVMTAEEATANKDKFTGPHRALGYIGTLMEPGVVKKVGPDEYVVIVRKSTSTGKTLEVLAHELGHIHQQQVYENADVATKNELIKSFNAWFRTARGGTAKELIESLRGKRVGRATRGTLDIPAKDMANPQYWFSFNEWYADQVSRWAMSNEKPVGVVEQFFAKLGASIKKFFENVKAAKFLPNETFAQYLDKVTASVDFTPANVAAENDQMSLFARGTVEGAPPTDYRNYRGEEMPPSAWENPVDTKFDTFQYKIVDKNIDTKRVIENIKKAVGDISDKFNAYIKEELYHGRTAKGIHDFLQKELLPITKDMKAAGVTIDELDEYLHNRHAEEYNNHINKINPNPKLHDKGSGISTEKARDYLEKLSAERKATFEALAKQVDSIVRNTQDLLVKAGIEEKSTIDAWRRTFPFYVPLKRDELEYVTTGGGVGAGYGTRGGASKRAAGSLKSVVDIFENIALQREEAVMKAEKARLGRALYGLAIQNPNPSFWLPINPDAIKNKAKLKQEIEDLGLNPEDADKIAREPVTSSIDKKTGMVKYEVNPLLRNSKNVFPIRINGKDRFIIFNSSDPRALRMVKSLNNIDPEQLGLALGTIGEVTRFMASVNTQYNPVFGAWNFMRDVQGAALNLTTTEIAGHEKEVLKGVWPALKSIYSDLRAQRAGKEPKGEWQELFEQYQKAGGATGYREQFSRGNDKPKIVERELKKLDRGNVRKAADAVFNWLSDYNDAMENAVRLSAFKVALDQGLSEDKAASLAKNLTVNFNRKGASSPTLQALYAFFNASVQGTKRLAETLKGPAGRKIVAGGMMIGVMQAIALAMAGYDDDEPPEFLKDKNLILPMPDGNYLIVPMPMGFNIFPGIGRLTTEYILGQAGLITGAKSLGDKTLSAASLILDSFNPLGSGSLLQIVSPTAFDPLAAIQSNKDAFGRPISKEDRATAPTPGFMRSREGASWFGKNLAEFLNYVSSPMGTKYTKGAISPTADQIDYLVGQYTGGVGREVMKTGDYVKAVAKGETGELPSYRVPIVGKVYGETTTPAAISTKFYQNVTELAKHENEIKQRMKNREDVREYRADHPETRFINRANYLENQITQLNKQKKTLQEKGAPEDRIKKIDEQKTKLMKGLNDQIKKLQQ